MASENLPATEPDTESLMLEWAAEEIEAMAAPRRQRQILASPSPAFAAMSAFATSWLPRSSDRLVVDGAAGLGGVTDALTARLDARVVGIEPSATTCRAARRLFPESTFLKAAAGDWPIPAGGVDAVVLAGALSTSRQPTTLLEEVDRVLAPGGRVILLDVVASGDTDRRSGDRIFRSLESIEQLVAGSVEVVELAAADGWLGDWHLTATPVNRAVARRHRGDPGFEHWLERQRHLERVVSSGEVLLAGIIAARPGTDGARPGGGSVHGLRRHRQSPAR